ncbi:unnamed protein product [Lactuca virosa]|uniref:Uncharacterized protein n=1 Tax=Lactuca virosa TaxID=75947 RepID=A0AAU9MUL1_9ASTR|nr:unnamed protein product [Lactuca virosa]
MHQSFAILLLENVSQLIINEYSMRLVREEQDIMNKHAYGGSSQVVATTYPKVIMPENFPPMELCCLTLEDINAKQLWEGYKSLPNLRMIKLKNLKNLMKTPDFKGLLNLEIFMVYEALSLKEIHPSFAHLEKLVYVTIEGCYTLDMVPPIKSSKQLETLSLSGCNILPQNMNIGPCLEIWFFSGCLRKLDLSLCSLEDGDIISTDIWDIPNLQVLDLEENNFSRLNFGLFRLPRLKWLNVSCCEELVELSGLPSSISVVIADYCSSLESFGDISNCKWLWKVSLLGDNQLGPLGGDILLKAMLQGNAKDYFISIKILGIDIWRGRSGVWVDWLEPYNMPLPHDWYNDFSGILMFVRSRDLDPEINISMKRVLDKDFQSLHLKVSNETGIETCYHDTIYLGYFSFRSLRHTGCLNSTYNIISFSLGDEGLYGDWYAFRAVLVPKDDVMQTRKDPTDCSGFWDEEFNYGKTFTLQHDSNSSIEIVWKPVSW